MSINVTVSGNPLSIKRGKMVTADPDYAKKEFQRRRRIRKQQVEQQSKDIAAKVRDKVRKEKTKQLSQIEQEGANKLKEWQNRKLLQLEQQYCECLKDIGLGHAEAEYEETREGLINAYKDVLREKCKERGYAATKRLQEESQKDLLKKVAPVQRKANVRGLENVRSAMVSKIKSKKKSPFKKKKYKTPGANINISTIVDETESDVDTSVTEESNSSPQKLKSPNQTGENTTTTTSKRESPERNKIICDNRQQIKERRRNYLPERSPPGTPEEFNIPMDTRISDRIKRRLNVPLNQSISKTYLNDNFNNFKNQVTQSEPLKTEIPTQTRYQLPKTFAESSTEPRADFHHHQPPRSQQERLCNDIPEKPEIAMKRASKASNKIDVGSFSKVQYYDHSNRFSKEYLCDNACVQRADNDSIQMCLSTSSEKEVMERAYQRDRDAQERGKKAMEKEKIHRDYKELMQQLPVLQRQERIASINSNNPVFHMSDDRMKQYELKRQNQMEEAYERRFPNTPLITCPLKKHDAQTAAPFRTIDVSTSKPAPFSNLATWDVDALSKDVIVTKDDGMISLSAQGTQDRTEYLKNLLDKLKKQKEMLMMEVKSLPMDNNLHDVIKELVDLENKDPNKKTQGHEPRVQEQKKSTNTFINTEKDSVAGSKTSPTKDRTKKTTTKSTSSHSRFKHKIALSSSSSSSSSPRKKLKQKRYAIILQNTSTQTTPKQNSPAPTTKPSFEHGTQERPQKQQEIKTQERGKKKTSSSQTDFRPTTSQSKSIVSTTASEKDKIDSAILLEKFKKIRTRDAAASTKISPKNIKRVGSPPARSSENVTVKSCECKDEVCEILIKIKDDEPEITIKSPKKKPKSLLVKTDVKKKVEAKKQLQFQQPTTEEQQKEKKVKKSDTTVKSTSWKECFSKNNSGATSTSTSYYSPPDFSLPKQDKKLDPRLLTYIKKLLSMSRASIEDLGVSSVSEISTPTPSLINSERNDPLNQLRTIIKYFNLNPDELAQCLTYSDVNTKSTISNSSRGFNSSSSNSSTFKSVSATNDSQQGYKAISKRIENVVEQTARNIQNNNEENSSDVLSQYTKTVEMFHKRITNLSEMIEKVRHEKQQMLSPNISDKENNSTCYMNLPSQELSTEKPKSPSSNSDAEQSELTRKLLEIDYSFAEKLQKLTPTQMKTEIERVHDQRKSQAEIQATDDDVEDELLQRYKALLNFDTSPKTDKDEAIPFVPLLLDIPRLPKLTLSAAINSDENEDLKDKKPPPSKGLYAAKKFNNNITNVPHELSTIVEVDSQLSTKLRRSTSPINQTDQNIFDEVDPVIVLPNPQPDQAKPSSDESLIPDILIELSQQNPENQEGKRKQLTMRKQLYQMSQIIAEQSTDSSTEKSEFDTVEEMLKSMGMGWAVATIRKTQEALTKASSSTSSEASEKIIKKKLSGSNSKSDSSEEISLRQFLEKKVFSSSGSKTSDSSLSPFLQELQEISIIQGSGGSSVNKNQRTSTPVHTTKSSEKSKDVLQMESDLSSVKSKSDDMFMTIPGDISTSHSKSSGNL